MLRKIAGLASRGVLLLPPIRGLGLVLEYASRACSGINSEIVTRFDGSWMSANPSIVDGRRALFTSRYHDRRERKFVKAILRRGDYAVDLGANVGLYTLLFARLVGDSGLVTAIEAEPNNAARLRYNVALNSYSNVIVEERGASDKVEALQLHISGTNLGMHSFVSNEGCGHVEVQCSPLSDLLIDQAPRLMKIDIEGFEFRVLTRYFADKPKLPEYIMLEDWDNLRQGDVLGICKENGYNEVFRFGPNVILKRVWAARSEGSH